MKNRSVFFVVSVCNLHEKYYYQRKDCYIICQYGRIVIIYCYWVGTRARTVNAVFQIKTLQMQKKESGENVQTFQIQAQFSAKNLASTKIQKNLFFAQWATGVVNWTQRVLRTHSLPLYHNTSIYLKAFRTVIVLKCCLLSRLTPQSLWIVPDTMCPIAVYPQEHLGFRVMLTNPEFLWRSG